jgi:hypothetical protein
MPLLDAHGNPVSSDTPEASNGLVTEPIDQIPTIPDEPLAAVVAQCNAALAQGAPANAPIGVDLGLLASLARTVRDQRALLRETMRPYRPEIAPDNNGLVMPDPGEE